MEPYFNTEKHPVRNLGDGGSHVPAFNRFAQQQLMGKHEYMPVPALPGGMCTPEALDLPPDQLTSPLSELTRSKFENSLARSRSDQLQVSLFDDRPALLRKVAHYKSDAERMQKEMIRVKSALAMKEADLEGARAELDFIQSAGRQSKDQLSATMHEAMLSMRFELGRKEAEVDLLREDVSSRDIDRARLAGELTDTKGFHKTALMQIRNVQNKHAEDMANLHASHRMDIAAMVDAHISQMKQSKDRTNRHIAAVWLSCIVVSQELLRQLHQARSDVQQPAGSDDTTPHRLDHLLSSSLAVTLASRDTSSTASIRSSSDVILYDTPTKSLSPTTPFERTSSSTILANLFPSHLPENCEDSSPTKSNSSPTKRFDPLVRSLPRKRHDRSTSRSPMQPWRLLSIGEDCSPVHRSISHSGSSCSSSGDSAGAVSIHDWVSEHNTNSPSPLIGHSALTPRGLGRAESSASDLIFTPSVRDSIPRTSSSCLPSLNLSELSSNGLGSIRQAPPSYSQYVDPDLPSTPRVTLSYLSDSRSTGKLLSASRLPSLDLSELSKTPLKSHDPLSNDRFKVSSAPHSSPLSRHSAPHPMMLANGSPTERVHYLQGNVSEWGVSRNLFFPIQRAVTAFPVMIDKLDPAAITPAPLQPLSSPSPQFSRQAAYHSDSDTDDELQSISHPSLYSSVHSPAAVSFAPEPTLSSAVSLTPSCGPAFGRRGSPDSVFSSSHARSPVGSAWRDRDRERNRNGPEKRDVREEKTDGKRLRRTESEGRLRRRATSPLSALMHLGFGVGGAVAAAAIGSQGGSSGRGTRNNQPKFAMPEEGMLSPWTVKKELSPFG